jgi:hypothetical protein
MTRFMRKRLNVEAAPWLKLAQVLETGRRYDADREDVQERAFGDDARFANRANAHPALIPH